MKTAEYALRTVACLAGEAGQSEPADLLCERTKVPRRYLHKVLQDLVHAQLVHSRSGPGGGYSLSRSPVSQNSSHTMLDLAFRLRVLRAGHLDGDEGFRGVHLILELLGSMPGLSHHRK